MITPQKAMSLISQHLGSTQRARHSIFVGYVMEWLARKSSNAAGLWMVTGYCHDLDYFVTEADPARHGLVTAEWLKDDLPGEALAAIRAHDHRTGVRSDTSLADALKLADAVAVAELTAGRESLVSALDSADPRNALRSILADRPHLPSMIVDLGERSLASLGELASVCMNGPLQ